MNNTLYKCRIITHHSLHCIAQRSDRTSRHSDDMGTSRKEQLSLLDFKLNIAACLCAKSEPGVKRKGRLIIETKLNIKQRRGDVLIPKAIRTDQTDHWPEMTTTIERCKNPDCKRRSRVICRKCGTDDVKVNVCFRKEIVF